MNGSRALAPLLVMTAGAVLLIDQLTKTIVRTTMAVCPDVALAPCDRVAILGPLGVLRTDNGASAFELSGSTSLVPLLALALILLGAEARMARPTPLFRVGLGLQLGGLVANVVDRVVFGTVTDFIHLQLGGTHQGPVANPADIALVIGGVIAAVALLRVSPGERLTDLPAQDRT